jgi:hypothetical protein
MNVPPNARFQPRRSELLSAIPSLSIVEWISDVTFASNVDNLETVWPLYRRHWRHILDVHAGILAMYRVRLCSRFQRWARLAFGDSFCRNTTAFHRQKYPKVSNFIYVGSQFFIVWSTLTPRSLLLHTDNLVVPLEWAISFYKIGEKRNKAPPGCISLNSL